MVAHFNQVGDGNGRYGTNAYTRTFTIGDDIETHVYVDAHKTVVTKNGQVIRTMLSDAGNPKFPTWDGTMAVVGKAAKVRMTSCSVGIACNPKDPNFYDITLPWDVQITWSGTYLHYSTGDPNPGREPLRQHPPEVRRRSVFPDVVTSFRNIHPRLVKYAGPSGRCTRPA